MQRGPFTGLNHIVRFNWHYYLLVIFFIGLMLWMALIVPVTLQWIPIAIAIAVLIVTLISLIASWYIYDVSELYTLHWLPDLNNKKVLQLHAGFDEISAILKKKYPAIILVTGDFYDPQKNTEVSIRRARTLFPPDKETVSLKSNVLPFKNGEFDCVMIMMTAHEIRNEQERIAFFAEVNRVVKQDGSVYMTEHLRDIPNVLIYWIGAWHFYGLSVWRSVFISTNFIIRKSVKTTPFVTTFELHK